MPVAPGFLFDGPTKATRTIALAQGAGVGMDCPVLEFFATRLGERGYRIVRFEYPHMAARLSTAKVASPRC